MAKQFKLKDVLERTRFSVVDVFSENQLHNVFMKAHNKISTIVKVLFEF